MASTHKSLRSSTANKRPTTAIADGQIALNTNTTSPGLFFKDSTGATIIKVGPVHVGTTAPNASPAVGGSSGNSTGEVWLDTSLTPNGVKIWNGSAWVNVTPAGSTTVQGLLELATSAETQTGSDTDRAVTPAGLQSKVSDSISTTSSTTIASSTAVKSAYDLANAALPKSGGTVTGNLEIGTTGSLSFEGATADGFETTIAVTDPTADRTITLPDTTGTVVLDQGGQTVQFGLGAAATPSITFTGDPNTGIYSPGADQVAISTNGSGRLFIDSSGNIGVAYSSPSNFAGGDLGASAPLVVGDGTGSRNLTLFSANNLYGSLAFADSTTGSAKYAGLIQYYHVNDSMQFYTGSTLQMVIDSSGRLGLGTSSPGEKLDISSGTSGTAAVVKIQDPAGRVVQIASPSSSTEAYIGTTTNHRFDFYTNNTVKATLDTTGRLGIGTTSPSSSLVVSNGGANGIEFGPINGDIFTYNRSTSAYTDTQITCNEFVVRTNGSNERARIDSSGRLLVGTNAPRTPTTGGAAGNHPFQVETAGATSVYSTASIYTNSNVASLGAYLELGRSKGTTVTSQTIVASEDLLGQIRFAGTDGTAPRQAATISAFVDGTPGLADMPGRLVFSTTPDGLSTPTERMRIQSTGETNILATNTCLGARSQAGAGTTDRLVFGVYGATSTTLTGTISFTVWTNGDVVNTNNSYGSISDLKLKENIVDASSQWDDIKALQVRKYNFKEGQTHTQIGLIAQEVELVSPGLVSESPDRDADGNDLGTVTKSVNYSVLYMKAVKALQEAMERIETLEAKVASLEAS